MNRLNSLKDQLYREEILDLWRNPVNYGEIDKPDIEAKALNPLCGDEIKIQLKLQSKSGGRNPKISLVKFSGNGCVISQVSASILTKMIEGKTISEAGKIGKEEILKVLGISPGPARLKCVILALSVFKRALLAYGKKVKS